MSDIKGIPHDLKEVGPEEFINRELSWLDFNERVLNQARDKENPLFERLNFLSITSTNLDEFVMVRIGSLKDQVHAGYKKPDISGMTPLMQLKAISDRVHEMLQVQYSTYNRSLLPKLKEAGIHILKAKDMNKPQRKYIERYFNETLYPILTPMAVDAGRPFPLVQNETHNIAVLLADKDEKKLRFATVQVPVSLPRLVRLPVDQDHGKSDSDIPMTLSYILLEDVIHEHLPAIFNDYEIKSKANYRIMRNAGFDIDEEDAADLLTEIEKQLKKRQWGEVIRLEVDDDIDKRILAILQNAFVVDKEDTYKVPGPIDLSFLSKLNALPEVDDRQDLRYPSYSPKWPAMLKRDDAQDIFAAIQRRDILLSHPYESFDPVLAFVRQAARDPDVLAIKQTLYRVSGRSPIISYLAEAAANGKQVLVLLELKARFDEENNIQWARKLEQAGCHVIYGLVGLKTHSKITLVVRQEEEGIRRYVHLGTGNYNDKTARLYTDLGLFTSSEGIGTDATEFFNMISGYAEPPGWNKLIIAPYHLRTTFVSLIDREINNAKEGKEAWIRAKMNSLNDEGIIRKLYEASAAGVRIELIVRGICCLRAGVPHLSENIHVRSLVGRWLEHSRIYAFANAGYSEIFLSSADWMPRNLDRRVEITFPVEDEECMKRIEELLDLHLEDTERATIMQEDGTYKQPDRRGKVILDSMVEQQELAHRRADPEPDPRRIRRFIPKMSPDEYSVRHIDSRTVDAEKQISTEEDDFFDKKIHNDELTEIFRQGHPEEESSIRAIAESNQAYYDDLSD